MSEATDLPAIIADLKRALREERRFLQLLIDRLPDPIYVKNRDSRFLLANQATALIMGATSGGDLIGRSDHDFYPSGLADMFKADEAALIRDNTALLDREERVVDPSGRELCMLTTKVPMHNDYGWVVGLIGVSRDITARRKQEEALEVENRRLRQLIDRNQEEILQLRAELQRAPG
jgi:PAS domain S-box-containing protein